MRLAQIEELGRVSVCNAVIKIGRGTKYHYARDDSNCAETHLRCCAAAAAAAAVKSASMIAAVQLMSDRELVGAIAANL